MSVERIPFEAINQAQRFQEDVERYVKKYQPDIFIVQMASLVDTVFHKKDELMAKYPLHFLLHAMEANCAYHRKYPPEPISDKNLNKLINVYHNYRDPVSGYFLFEQKCFNFQTSLYFVFMARQQFYLQLMDNKNALSRSMFLFEENQYPKSIKKMEELFGFGFKEWLIFTFSIFGFVFEKKSTFNSSQLLKW